MIRSRPVSRRRVVQAVGIGLALIGATGCESVAKIQDVREKEARSDALRKVQTDSNARRDALLKELDQATWGQPNEYQLQREDTMVWLWRANRGEPKNADGVRQGSVCALNPYPNQLGACKENEVKIGRILFDMEDADKRMMDATGQLMQLWADDKKASPVASPAPPTGVRP